MYNTITATTTSFDMDGIALGYTVNIKTLDYFDTIVLLLIPFAIYFVVGIFKRRK